MSEHDQPVADNLLDRQFVAAARNQRWVGEPPDSSLWRAAGCISPQCWNLFSRFTSGGRSAP